MRIMLDDKIEDLFVGFATIATHAVDVLVMHISLTLANDLAGLFSKQW